MPFRPPTAREIVAALGSQSKFSPKFRSLVDILMSRSPPISRPGPDDWLAQIKETPQTVADYVLHRKFAPSPERSIIYILPLAPFAPPFPPVATLREYLEAFYFPNRVAVLPAVPLEGLGLTTRIFEGRLQIHAGSVVARVAPTLPPDGFCLCAITQEDLYPRDSWSFVFGHTEPSKRCGVFSFARYNPGFPGTPSGSLLRRSCKVLAHETGHLFGLKHCLHYRCAMNGSNSLEESEGRPVFLCPVCLGKMYRCVPFDPLLRYRVLGAFFDAHRTDFPEELEEVRHRLEMINAPPRGDPKRR
ncbi:putative peptidase family M54 protein [Paratrimastix pyriformis]|uniref:Peptidase family M54 protein n=1 Tax=Paratrimastix pyriformis TaxID=342808 RepID=A0ABQ8V0H0_9EUKA|nr:putative peptidase family M54 protein [Paratrimastix pyriformis]